MKLASKLIATFLAVTIVVLVVDAYVEVRGAVAVFEMDMKQDARRLGTALSEVITDDWEREGLEGALKLVDRVNRGERQLRVRWVWLEDNPDTKHDPAVPLSHLGSTLTEGITFARGADVDGSAYLYTYVPVAVESGPSAALEIAEPLLMRDRFAFAAAKRAAILIALLVAASGLFVFFFGMAWIGRPLRQLIDVTRQVGSGDLSAPAQLHGHDELSELSRAFNEMCEQLAVARDHIRSETEARLTALDQLRHADRLRTVGTLASGIAHELGTPLNVVSGRASLLIGTDCDLSPETVSENANIIKAQADRMARIIRQLLDFARRQPREMTACDMQSVINDAANLLESMARKRKVEIVVQPVSGPLRATVDPSQIQQVLINLLINAMQAMPRGGTIRMTGCLENAQPPDGLGCESGTYLRISVEDEGIGITEEDLGHLFDPFFTTKDVGEGTGLGLSIAYGMVREHGGWIHVESTPDEGSCFSIYLPAETRP
jgi:two-component system NtrC family sensor kinase